MTRIEQSDDTVASLQREVSSLKQQVQKGKGRMRRLAVRLVSFFVLVLLVGGVGMYLSARAGFAAPTFMRNRLYTTPMPSYPVAPATGTALSEKITQTGRAYAARGAKGDLSLTLTEGELTALAYQGINLSKSERVAEAQVAILDSELEVFMRLSRPRDIYITAGIVPRAEGGRVHIDVTRLRIGQLAIPPSWGTGVVRLLVEAPIRHVLDLFDEFGTIRQIDVRDGTTSIHISPKR